MFVQNFKNERRTESNGKFLVSHDNDSEFKFICYLPTIILE